MARDYAGVAAAMKNAATAEGVATLWGGNWRSFKDGPRQGGPGALPASGPGVPSGDRRTLTGTADPARERAMQAILARLRQPSSITGVAAIVGAVMGAATGAADYGSAFAAVVGGLVATVPPDNSEARAAAERAAAAAAAVKATRRA